MEDGHGQGGKSTCKPSMRIAVGNCGALAGHEWAWWEPDWGLRNGQVRQKTGLVQCKIWLDALGPAGRHWEANSL